jgi:hypothetical protein
VYGAERERAGGALECFISLGEAHDGPSSARAKRRGAAAGYWAREAVHETEGKLQSAGAC